MRKRVQTGNIDFNQVQPEVHEYAAYLVLAKSGKNLKLLPPSAKFKVHSADFEMDGLIWELKCPQGKGKYVIRDTLRQASKQSNNIVVDLRRCKLSQNRAISQINKYFLIEKKLHRVIVITKEQVILDIKK